MGANYANPLQDVISVFLSTTTLKMESVRVVMLFSQTVKNVQLLIGVFIA